MVRFFLLFFLTIAIFISPVAAVSFENNAAVASDLTISATYSLGNTAHGSAGFISSTNLGSLAQPSSITWEYDVHGKVMYGTVSYFGNGIRIGLVQNNDITFGSVSIGFGPFVDYDDSGFTAVDPVDLNYRIEGANVYLYSFTFSMIVDSVPDVGDRFVVRFETLQNSLPPVVDPTLRAALYVVTSSSFENDVCSMNIANMSGETGVYWINNTLYFPLTDCDISMYLDVNSTASFYLVLSNRINIVNGNYVNYNFGLLNNYRVPDKDTFFTYFDTSYYKYDIIGIDPFGELDYYINLVDDPAYKEFSVTAYRFENVPAGTYNFSVSDPNLISNDGVYSDKNFLIYGLYVVLPSALEDFVNGHISFDDASTSIMDQTNQAFSDSSGDPVAQQLVLAEGQWELDQLVQYSDEKFLTVYESTTELLDTEILKFRNKTIDLNTALSSFGSTFVTALEKADTPGQGTLLNTLYTLKLNQLELQAKVNATQTLDQAISDEEMDYVDSYYQSEEELLSKFDLQAYKDLLVFNSWINQLDISEASTYKSYFDRLIYRTDISLYIVLPITMILVSIILGTRIHLPRSGRSASDFSSIDKSGAGDQ